MLKTIDIKKTRENVPAEINEMVAREVAEGNGFTEFYPDEWFSNPEIAKYDRLAQMRILTPRGKILFRAWCEFCGNKRDYITDLISLLEASIKEKEDKIKDLDNDYASKIKQRDEKIQKLTKGKNYYPRESQTDEGKKIYDEKEDIHTECDVIVQSIRRTQTELRELIRMNKRRIQYHKDFKVHRIKKYHLYFKIHDWALISEQLKTHADYRELYDIMEKQVNDTIAYNRTNKRKHATITVYITVLENETIIEPTWEINRYIDGEDGTYVSTFNYNV